MGCDNEANPEVVADVRVPHQNYTAFVNTLLTKSGDLYEVWLKFGKKNWQIADGSLEEMTAKHNRVRRFIQDPLAPAPASLEEFVLMARGL